MKAHPVEHGGAKDRGRSRGARPDGKGLSRRSLAKHLESNQKAALKRSWGAALRSAEARRRQSRHAETSAGFGPPLSQFIFASSHTTAGWRATPPVWVHDGIRHQNPCG